MKKYNLDDNPLASLAEPLSAYGVSEETMNSLISNNRFHHLKDIENGLSLQTLQAFMKISGLHIEELASIFHITSRTLRRLEDSKPLNKSISEKLVLLFRLYSKGVDSFGHLSAFNSYLRKPIRALGYRKPLELLDTSIGIELVMEELVRIDHGVYS